MLSKTFERKTDAQTWAAEIEGQIGKGTFVNPTFAERTTLNELLDRFEAEILPSLRGQKAEKTRIKHLRRELGKHTLVELTPCRLAEFRQERLKALSPQSVKHELGLLNRVLKLAHGEWGIHLPGGVPTVKAPRLPRGRERRLEAGELERLLEALAVSPTAQTMVQFALETAMRRGELCAMRWEDVDMRRGVLHIPQTKTMVPRTIPLTSKAVAILKRLPRNLTGKVWNMTPDGLTHAFVKACRRAGIEDLHLHDLRHEATSRLIEKGLSTMEVSAITGHQSLDMLKRYAHLRPEDIREKLG
ncbi:tyrosine-type recombinase/integrase [Methylocaldum szegediense]|jgi:integrase|nr:site-specific integrase [Methylocaldum szegediense]